MPKQTPLNALHRAAGARMVDFGGWDMPVNYGSQIDEHHAVRTDAGMFDVSHMRVVDLEGAGARDFLRYVLANNVDKLQDPGQGAVFVPAQARRHRDRRPDRLLPARGLLPPRRQRRHRGQATSPGSASGSPSSAPAATLTPRPDLAIIAVQGPNARAQAAEGAARGERAVRSLKPFNADARRPALRAS